MKWNEVTTGTLTAVLERVNDETTTEYNSPEEAVASLVRAVNEINVALTDVAANAPLEVAQKLSEVVIGQLNSSASFAAQIIHSRARYAAEPAPTAGETDVEPQEVK